MEIQEWYELGKKLGYYQLFENKILSEFEWFICKEGYTDADIYAEEPTAIERYLQFKRKQK